MRTGKFADLASNVAAQGSAPWRESLELWQADARNFQKGCSLTDIISEYVFRSLNERQGC